MSEHAPPSPVVVAAAGPLTAAAVVDLADSLERVLATAGRGDIVVLDVGGVTTIDIGTVDALCRLTLSARRHGRRLIVRGASADLRRLLGLAGLDDVVRCADVSVEPGR